MSLRNINIKKVIDKQVVKQDYKARLQSKITKKKKSTNHYFAREKTHKRLSSKKNGEFIFPYLYDSNKNLSLD